MSSLKHKSKLTPQQKSQIINDIYFRNKDLDTIFDRFTQEVGSKVQRGYIRSEIVKLLSEHKRDKYLPENDYDGNHINILIGSKTEPYFKDEYEYIFPNYTFEELIEENPYYEKQNDLGTSSRTSSFNDNYNDLIRNDNYVDVSKGKGDDS